MKVAGDCRKRLRLSPEIFAGGCDFFDALPDDIVLSILSKLSSIAGCPADFINVLITCKRLNPVALYRASGEMLAVKAYNWSESGHLFLKLCADAGNVEACFTLGMVRHRVECAPVGRWANGELDANGIDGDLDVQMWNISSL